MPMTPEQEATFNRHRDAMVAELKKDLAKHPGPLEDFLLMRLAEVALALLHAHDSIDRQQEQVTACLGLLEATAASCEKLRAAIATGLDARFERVGKLEAKEGDQ